MQETQVRSLGQEDPLEREMATPSSIFAWEIPRTEEPGLLQSLRLQWVGYNLETKQQHLQTYSIPEIINWDCQEILSHTQGGKPIPRASEGWETVEVWWDNR